MHPGQHLMKGRLVTPVAAVSGRSFVLDPLVVVSLHHQTNSYCSVYNVGVVHPPTHPFRRHRIRVGGRPACVILERTSSICICHLVALPTNLNACQIRQGSVPAFTLYFLSQKNRPSLYPILLLFCRRTPRTVFDAAVCDFQQLLIS